MYSENLQGALKKNTPYGMLPHKRLGAEYGVIAEKPYIHPDEQKIMQMISTNQKSHPQQQ